MVNCEENDDNDIMTLKWWYWW